MSLPLLAVLVVPEVIYMAVPQVAAVAVVLGLQEMGHQVALMIQLVPLVVLLAVALVVMVVLLDRAA